MRGVPIIDSMVIDMNEAQVPTLEQVRLVLAGTQALEFRRAEDDQGRYGWIKQVLRRFGYRQLGRADKGVGLEHALRQQHDRLRRVAAAGQRRRRGAGARGAADAKDARRDLLNALAEPFADRLLHPHLEAARIVLGRCELSLGRADAARAAVRSIRYSVALESGAHAVRLAAGALDGRADAAGLEAATQLLDSGRLPPLHALGLMRAIAAVRGKRGVAGWRERMRSIAQSLADSLRGDPALQASFIRRHRDLLT